MYANVALTILWSMRVLSAIGPQYGYLQPDEFFQSVEPIAGHVLDTHVLTAWELNASFALRNTFVIQLLYWPVFSALSLLRYDASPYALLVAPRLVVTLLSFVCDYSLISICKQSQSYDSFATVVTFATSYLTVTYLTHTFSNSVETVLLALLLARVLGSVKSKNDSIGTSIGAILSVGLFNRPTFVLFACPSLLFWLVYNCDKNSKLNCLLRRTLSCVPSFVLVSLILCLTDTVYYRLSLWQIWEHLINYRYNEIVRNAVITPVNFIEYNTNRANLATHGLHAPYFHAIVSVPLAFSLVGLFAYYDVLKIVVFCVKHKLTRVPVMSAERAILLLSFVTPLIGFSLIPHQEPRFLIPCLLPLCVLYANKIVKQRLCFIIWIIINSALFVFYAHIHQSGVTKGLFAINKIAHNDSEARIDVVFSRLYLPPRYLLSIPNSAQHIHIHDLSTLEFPTSMDSKLSELQAESVQHFYLLIPSCLSLELQILLAKYNARTLQLINQFFPHFTFEDIDSSIKLLNANYELTFNIHNAFSMNLWKVEL